MPDKSQAVHPWILPVQLPLQGGGRVDETVRTEAELSYWGQAGTVGAYGDTPLRCGPYSGFLVGSFDSAVTADDGCAPLLCRVR